MAERNRSAFSLAGAPLAVCLYGFAVQATSPHPNAAGRYYLPRRRQVRGKESRRGTKKDRIFSCPFSSCGTLLAVCLYRFVARRTILIRSRRPGRVPRRRQVRGKESRRGAKMAERNRSAFSLAGAPLALCLYGFAVQATSPHPNAAGRYYLPRRRQVRGKESRRGGHTVCDGFHSPIGDSMPPKVDLCHAWRG